MSSNYHLTKLIFTKGTSGLRRVLQRHPQIENNMNGVSEIKLRNMAGLTVSNYSYEIHYDISEKGVDQKTLKFTKETAWNTDLHHCD